MKPRRQAEDERGATPPAVRGLGAGQASRPARRRLVVLGLALGLLVLGAEVAWYSDPVQDWRTGRQPLSRLRELAQEQPGSTRIRYYYAAALLRAGQADQSLEQARAGIVMDPISARLYRVAGMAELARGEVEPAFNSLTRARELGDRSPLLFERLAVLHMDARHFGEAARLLEECLRYHPREAEAWYRLGQCRGALGMPEGWTQAEERATHLAPADGSAWESLAESWLFRDRPDQALRAAERAVSLQPRDPVALLTRARCLSALAKTDPELARAGEAFRQALEIPRRDPAEAAAAWREYGRFLLENGRSQDAVAALERVARWTPEDQKGMYALAQAYRRVGDSRKAEAALAQFERSSAEQRDIRYLQSRVSANPRDARALLALARALARVGRTREADFYYESAFRIQPDILTRQEGAILSPPQRP
jgi:tetratricopeptide (TPR) repeat protein